MALKGYFESYVGSVVATIMVDATLGTTQQKAWRWITLPLGLICLGLITSIIGVVSIHAFRHLDLQ